MANLQFLHQEKITSSVSSTSIDNIFSSAYDIYCITCNEFSTTGTSGTFLAVRFIDNSGSVITGSEYQWADLEMNSSAGFSSDRSSSDTYMRIQGAFDQKPEKTGAVIYVYNPYESGYTFITTQSAGVTGGYNRNGKGIGVHKTAEIIRGFAIIESVSSRPYETGEINVFGVKS